MMSFNQDQLVPILVDGLKNSNPGVRSSFVQIVGRLGPVVATPEIQQLLKLLLNDSDSDVKCNTIKVIKNLNLVTEMLPLLISKLQDLDDNVRLNVLYAVPKGILEQ